MNRRNFLRLLTGVVAYMGIHPHELLTPNPLPGPTAGRHYDYVVVDDYTEFKEYLVQYMNKPWHSVNPKGLIE